jgi:hypothetical protein
MTEHELSEGIGEGLIDNQVYLFVTDETIREAGRMKDCPAVRKLAWAKHVAAVAEIPFPANGHNVKLLAKDEPSLHAPVTLPCTCDGLGIANVKACTSPSPVRDGSGLFADHGD